MSAEGSGIGKMEDGMTVFVSGAVWGDLAEAEITKVKKNYALAECRLILVSLDPITRPSGDIELIYVYDFLRMLWNGEIF